METVVPDTCSWWDCRRGYSCGGATGSGSCRSGSCATCNTLVLHFKVLSRSWTWVPEGSVISTEVTRRLTFTTLGNNIHGFIWCTVAWVIILKNIWEHITEIHLIQNLVSVLQRAALGQPQGVAKSLPESSTGWLAILQLLCSQARNNLQEELWIIINKTLMTDLVQPAV